MSRSSIALGNLRGAVIVIVLAFHSVLAYLASLPDAPYSFNTPPYRWQAAPIIDAQRWFGFDLFCAWQDVSLMSLMFFLSGLFVPISLARKGSWTFLSDRIMRIGVPLVLVVAFLIPIAYYPAYAVTASDTSFGAFWAHWMALPFWAPGPQWFLWQLMAFNLLVIAVHRFVPSWKERLLRLVAPSFANPVRFFLLLVTVSAVAYIPLALAGTPWAWVNYGPFSFQVSRPLHYLVYFFAGCAVGAYGLDRGLLDCSGALARQWRGWLVAAVVGFVLWALPTSQTLDGAQPSLAIELMAGLGYAFACAAGCFAFLAICLRFATERTRALDSLSSNAYSMYLVHYVFVVWLQYAVMGLALSAIGKAATVFGGTLALSWIAAAGLSNLAGGAHFGPIRQWARSTFSLAPAKFLKQDDLRG